MAQESNMENTEERLHEDEHNHDHGHEHHHHDDDDCCCSHEHDHEHHHDDDDCCCSHEHDHEHEHQEEPEPDTKLPIKVYLVENLDCANCAAKIERKIRTLPGVEYATLTFATKQLRVAAKDHEALLPLMQEAAASIEPEVTVEPRKEGKPADNDEEEEDHKKDLICILAGALLFVAGKVTESYFTIPSLVLYVLAYLVLGLEIVITAVKNLFRGNLFDENFLMSIATIGAFAIGEYPEAVGVMLFYRIGEWFEHRAVSRSRSQIMEALDLRPETVNRIEGENIQAIPAEEAVVGDLLLVRPGDRIPLDGCIVEGESRVDTSPVTGEPVPVNVTPGNKVLSGCLNQNGVLKLQVEKPLSESMVSRILDSVENAAASKPKIDRFITRFSRIYTPFVVALAIATAVIPSLITGDWNTWVYTALTFLVISCPCALVLSVPLAFFSGIGAASRQKILFKGGSAIEALKGIKAVVMDKTGTVTKGEFAVQQVVSLDPAYDEDSLLVLAASCEAASTHPIAVSICDAAAKKGLSLKTALSVTEISGRGVLIKLSEGTVLCGNMALLTEQGVDVTDYRPASYGTEVLLAMDGKLIGYLMIADALKEGSAASIAALKKAGLTCVMLTGDAQANAEAIAAQAGIDEVHAKLLPEEKLAKLQDIRSRHGAVMFVGDGINDAPVLAGADVGAAMGSGADAAIEAADVVFMNSDPACIPASLRIARTTGRISTQNVVFALIVKALIMILGLCGIASMWLAVFADNGVAMLCILNSVRILYTKKR